MTWIANARAVAPDAWACCQPASADAAVSRNEAARKATSARFSTGTPLCSVLGRVLRIGGDLLRHRTDFATKRLVMLRVTQERLDPRLVCVLDRQILFEEQLAEEDADADVRERAEGEDAMRRPDEAVDLPIVGP